MHRWNMGVFAATLALAGCADKLLSDDRLRDTTAMTLGQPAAAVTISDRRYDGATNTYYTAHTPRGTYNCLINGGSVMAFGMTNPPGCSPAQSGLPPAPASRLFAGRQTSSR